MARFSVQLNGQPVFLYLFTSGSYDEKRRYICAHPKLLLPAQVRERIVDAVAQLPRAIEFNFMEKPIPPDLFERAIVLAGFVFVDGDILEGVSLPGLVAPIVDRDRLEAALTLARVGVR